MNIHGTGNRPNFIVELPDSTRICLKEVREQLAHGKLSRSELSEKINGMTDFSGLQAEDVLQWVTKLAEGATSLLMEHSIVRLMEHLEPKERAQFLRLYEGRASHHSVNHLLTDDIDRLELRNRAKALVKEAQPFLNQIHENVVISDIDDTVKPWKSPVRGNVFPGVKALYAALDEGLKEQGALGDIHFVSARDGILIKAEEDLEKTGIPYGSIHYGDSISGALGLMGFDRLMFDKKIKNINHLLAKNPDSKALLFGDSTQADPKVFQEILKKKNEKVLFALIHDIPGFDIPSDIAKNPKVIVFKDHFDAAKQLHERGVISSSQLQKILSEK